MLAGSLYKVGHKQGAGQQTSPRLLWSLIATGVCTFETCWLHFKTWLLLWKWRFPASGLCYNVSTVVVVKCWSVSSMQSTGDHSNLLVTKATARRLFLQHCAVSFTQPATTHHSTKEYTFFLSNCNLFSSVFTIFCFRFGLHTKNYFIRLRSSLVFGLKHTSLHQ